MQSINVAALVQEGRMFWRKILKRLHAPGRSYYSHAAPVRTGTFSTNAKHEATQEGASAIDLIGGEYLCGLLKSLGLGVRRG